MPLSHPDKGVIVKARRYDLRDTESIDLQMFDLIEIVKGHRRITVRVAFENDIPRICVAADDRLAVMPVASNWVDIPI